MSELPKTFDPASIESRWYAHWEASGQFRPEDCTACRIAQQQQPLRRDQPDVMLGDFRKPRLDLALDPPRGRPLRADRRRSQASRRMSLQTQPHSLHRSILRGISDAIRLGAGNERQDL